MNAYATSAVEADKMASNENASLSSRGRVWAVKSVWSASCRSCFCAQAYPQQLWHFIQTMSEKKEEGSRGGEAAEVNAFGHGGLDPPKLT